MTKEILKAKDELIGWVLGANWNIPTLEEKLDEFFKDKVIIQRGESRHPYADVLHEVLECTTLKLESRSVHEWEVDEDLYNTIYGMEYRIKPKEPIYEYQWIRLVNSSQDPNSMDYYGGS